MPDLYKRQGVGQMFLLARVEVHVLVAGIFADDHAFINFYARFKEEFASVENGVQEMCIRDRSAPSSST